MKKALSRKITELYMGSGIFTEYTRSNPETIIKKSKAFRQANFMKDAELSGSESSMQSLAFSAHYSSSKSSYTKMMQVAHQLDSTGKLSGKNTAATIGNESPSMLGFCDQEDEPKPKSRNLIRTISDSKGV
jgi:hypothetical protein